MTSGRRLPRRVVMADRRLGHVFMNQKRRTGWYSNDREMHGLLIRAGMAEAAAGGTRLGRPRRTLALTDAELTAIIARSQSLRAAFAEAHKRDHGLSWSTFWRRSRR